MNKRIQEVLNELKIEEEEYKRPLKEVIKEWLLRNIATKKKLQHLLTLQDIELTETKKNNTYLRKEKKKYKDLCVKLDKELKTKQIEVNELIKEYNKLERKLKKCVTK